MDTQIHADGIVLSAAQKEFITAKLQHLEHLGGRATDASVRAHVTIQRVSDSATPTYSVVMHIRLPHDELTATVKGEPGDKIEALVAHGEEKLHSQLAKR